MNVFSILIAVLCISAVFGGAEFEDLNSVQCVQVKQMHFTNVRKSGSAQTKPSDVSGYYIRRNNNLYTKVNDVNCLTIDKLARMFLKRSGSTWMVGKKANMNSGSAMYKNCKKRFPFSPRFPKGVCDNDVIISVRSTSASKCETPWKYTSDYSATMKSSVSLPGVAVIRDQPDFEQEWNTDTKDLEEPVDGVDDEPVDDDEPMEDDQPIDDDEPIEVDGEPQFVDDEEPVFDDEFPDDAAPVFAEPMADPNSITFTVSQDTLMIAVLVMSNIALVMAILYCREKNKGEKLVDFQ